MPSKLINLPRNYFYSVTVVGVGGVVGVVFATEDVVVVTCDVFVYSGRLRGSGEIVEMACLKMR